MKCMVYAGIILLLTGCGLILQRGRTVEPLPEGWYSQQKTDLQLSQDLSECRTLCRTA
jgi:hypothetical protein